ncbi:MAG TPA: tetratricopeptide repeat protein [Microthrixaceae bacterium]|nr:tetratricopeptide repeat protein [Microthrixaceae bacterium]HPB44412.1 tetratricopeptide repeat protein [Microthrixaceae bacterium]
MVEVTDATFSDLVLARSMQVPVVVDLWASWCQPCKTLGPILEAVIAETDGAVEFAKVDVDANPQVANAFQVKSIPAVFAMDQQQIVDSFLGAQSEAFVREFVAKLVPTAEQNEVERLYSLGDEASLRAALELEPTNERVVVALAELLVIGGRGEEAEALLAAIPEDAEVRRIRAQIRTGQIDAAGIDVELELAQLLDRVKTDDAARQRYIDLLELLGDDERVGDFRRKLTARLY